jgi:hypothetical protein
MQAKAAWDVFTPVIVHALTTLPCRERYFTLKGILLADTSGIMRKLYGGEWEKASSEFFGFSKVPHRFQRVLFLTCKARELAHLAESMIAGDRCNWIRSSTKADIDKFNCIINQAFFYKGAGNSKWTWLNASTADRYALHDMFFAILNRGQYYEDLHDYARYFKQTWMNKYERSLKARKGKNMRHKYQRVQDIREDALCTMAEIHNLMKDTNEWKHTNPNYFLTVFYMYRYGDPCQIVSGKRR